MRIAGIDIGGTTVKCGVVDPVQGLIDQTSLPTGRISPEVLVGQLHEWLAACPEPLAAVGVGAAGRVDPQRGTVRSGNLGWEDVPLLSLLRSGLSIPVWIDNDAQAALAAEWFYGVCKHMSNAVYLTLGTGVGGALLLEGRLYRGCQNAGAELGHMILHGGGHPCVCGRKGCFEQYASATALRRLAGERPVKEIILRANAGDRFMLQACESYFRELGLGLSSLQAIFAPEAFIIGGGISNAGSWLLEGIRRHYQGEVRLAAFRNDAGMLGAAALAGYHANLPPWQHQRDRR